ncbi:hypothetical protein D3C76_1456750 [compost metagenome]
MVYRQWRIGRLPAGKIGQWDRFTVVVNDVHFIQRTDVLGVARIDFHHHFVLVHRLINGGDLALTKGVIEQAVGCLNVDAQTRHSFAVIGQVHLCAVVLLVRVHICQFRQCRQRFTDFWLPLAQGGQIVRE